MFSDRQLTAIRVLAELGSFRAAAERLGMSPASFSRHIQLVENSVGQKLFERRRPGVRVTPAGKELLWLIDQFADACGAFEAGVGRLREAGGIRLSIGACPLTTRVMIAPIMERLRADLPELRVAVTVSATKEPSEMLRRGLLDVVVCDLTHTTDLADLDLHVIRKEPVTFWARSDHPVHSRGPLPLPELLRMPLATPHLNNYWRAALTQALGGDGEAQRMVERMPQFECDDYALLADMTMRSDMICGGMEVALLEHVRSKQLRQVKCTTPLAWNICAARRQGTGFAALDMFWDILVSEYGIGSEPLAQAG